MSKVALDPDSLGGASLTEDFGPVHQPLHATFRQFTLDVFSPMTIGVAEILVHPPGPQTHTTHLTVANLHLSRRHLRAAINPLDQIALRAFHKQEESPENGQG